MNTLTGVGVVAAVMLTAANPRPSQDCEAGYQTFLGDFSKLVHTTTGAEASDAVRRSLAVYDACKAGDEFSPDAAWNSIIDTLKSKTNK
jgi:hypothetical protein